MTIKHIDGYKLLNFASQVADNTLEQAKQTASMPFIYPHVALMPDAHFGKGSAVGTVIPTLDAVIPAAVGVDIGCGMIAARTNFTAYDIDRRDLGVLRESIESVIPLSPGNYNDDLERFSFTEARIETLQNLAWPDENSDHRNVDLAHSPKWRHQLGSLGGGNHFIELCLDQEDRVWLFLHSGSRGVGNKIAQKHIKVAQQLCKRWWIDLPNPDLAYLPQGTPEFSAYLRELNWAQRFALENRAEMMDRFALVFADWIKFRIRRRTRLPENFIEDIVNCHHNYTAKETICLKCIDTLDSDNRTDEHQPGARASIIPGSLGDYRRVPRSYDALVRAARGYDQGSAPLPTDALVRSLLHSLADDLSQVRAHTRSAELCGLLDNFPSARPYAGAVESAHMIASKSLELDPSAVETLRHRWDSLLVRLSDPDGYAAWSDHVEILKFLQAEPASAYDAQTRTDAAALSGDLVISASGSQVELPDHTRTHTDHPSLQHYTTLTCGHVGKDVWLTRKGAVDAHRGVRAIIPGSMGTKSYVVRGKGNPASLCSAPHGAGRQFSRTEARKRFTADDLAARMEGIEYRHGEQWVDEIPDAYKDIDIVMKDAEDLVEVEYELRQVLNVKGT